MAHRSLWSAVALSVLLSFQAACSWHGGVQGNCVRLQVSEKPRLGAYLRGTWVDDERFVLIDHKRGRLLEYGPDGERSLPGVVRERDVLSDIEAWRSGFVLGEEEFDYRRLTVRLTVLSSDYELERTLWSVDHHRLTDGKTRTEREDESSKAAGREHEADANPPITGVSTVKALGDRFYLVGRTTDWSVPETDPVLFRLSPSGDHGSRHPFRVDAQWPALGDEVMYWGMPGVPLLTVTSGAEAGAYALRFGDTVHIERLSDPTRRLSAFPDLHGPLPLLPHPGGSDVWTYFAVLEAASYPAGLYGDRASLFVLMKSVVDGEPVWELHRIDPVADELVGRTRLPTSATYVTLLPGPKSWALEEASSAADDLYRLPTGYLLLDAEAVHAGEALQCD